MSDLGLLAVLPRLSLHWSSHSSSIPSWKSQCKLCPQPVQLSCWAALLIFQSWNAGLFWGYCYKVQLPTFISFLPRKVQLRFIDKLAGCWPLVLLAIVWFLTFQEIYPEQSVLWLLICNHVFPLDWGGITKPTLCKGFICLFPGNVWVSVVIDATPVFLHFLFLSKKSSQQGQRCTKGTVVMTPSDLSQTQPWEQSHSSLHVPDVPG